MPSYNSYSSGMRECKLSIEVFTGVDQSHGLHSLDVGSSPDAVNFIARDGDLRTAGGVSAYGTAIPESDYDDEEEEIVLENGRIFQGYFRDSNGADFSKLILALQGRLFWADLDAEQWTLLSGRFATNDWTMVNYREGQEDAAILMNGIDDGQMWNGEDPMTIPMHIVQGRVTEEQNGQTVVTEEGEELHFSQITLLNERLWGGVSADYPDRIYWSNTFGPNDWEFNYEDSEHDGGGYIDVATFDGSRIRAVIAAMDDVLIFKDKSLHRLAGSYPGEFTLTQVYGTQGTLAPRTIVDTGKAVYFLSSDGLVRYSGMSAMPLSAQGDKKLMNLWERINPNTIDTACAAFMNNVIYLALPLDGSIINTHVIEYNLRDGTYSVLEYPGVDDWLVLREGQQETLLFLNDRQLYRYDSGYTFGGEPIEAVWTSPYISLATLASKKTTGRVYMSLTANSLDVNRPPSIKLSMISGDKVREKVIKLKNGLNEIRKRIKVRGRMFRFRIENVDGDPLTIHRGIEIHVEEDFD